ncbi:MAG TPA: FkbM family methyltransferase [Candidatus Saccharimonadia bacterium]|nr:FkbM family methyltransferase [Candidatus Saccharimonadia bacterium]
MSLEDILTLACGHDALREKLVAFCRDMDATVKLEDGSTRDQCSGPFLDAVMRGRVFRKKLACGVVIEMPYGNKISREFLLSPEPEPDHVWEPQTTKLLMHLATGVKHVVIGGAYVGDQAVPLARQMQSWGGVCHAFEPEDASYQFLKRNAEMNTLSNLLCEQAGLWDGDTRISLTGCDSLASPMKTDGDRADGIAARSLDSYAAEKGINEVGLIMLDTEGGEFAALRGAESFLTQPVGKAPHLVFEVHRHHVDWSAGLVATDIVRHVRERGYDVYAVRDYHSNHPMRGQPVELIPCDGVYLEGPPHGFNMLGIKDPEILTSPMFKIVRGVSPKLLLHRDPTLHQPVRD